MKENLNIAIAQCNPLVGNIADNVERIRAARNASQDADLVVFPELVVTGYPPEDLVLKPAFQNDAETAIQQLVEDTADGGPGLLLTSPWREGDFLYNAAILADGGQVNGLSFKNNLPNYGVFDEKRVFDAGKLRGPINFRGVKLGLMICEDMWTPDVAECLAETGAEILIVCNGSPYEDAKFDVRINLAVARVTEFGLPLIYVNQVGGQDELVFDGGSFAINSDKSLAVQMPTFVEKVGLTHWMNSDRGWRCESDEKGVPHEGEAAIYQAMVIGLRDYVNKNGFPGVVLGLSGGIDSALTAAVAVDAIGAERVWCVMLPSKYTSKESLDDAAECAKLLGARLDTVPIPDAVDAFAGMMDSLFDGRAPDVTEENIQARIRAVVLMALSNKFGHMVLTTGNKSEMSVGYATLYGDMCGGYSVLKDVYKTKVFQLSEWRNKRYPGDVKGLPGRVIPENILVKAPSAELRPDQKDEDTLPPYQALDDILTCLIEEEMSFSEIVSRGHDSDTVRRIEHLLYVAEYKRRQAPPGVKLTQRNFGRDRRYPITNAYRNIF